MPITVMLADVANTEGEERSCDLAGAGVARECAWATAAASLPAQVLIQLADSVMPAYSASRLAYRQCCRATVTQDAWDGPMQRLSQSL